MNDIVGCEEFLLLRAVKEQSRATQSIQSLTQNFNLLRSEVLTDCQSALKMVDEARRHSEILRQRATPESLKVVRMDLKIAERDRLIAILQKTGI